MAKAEIKTVHAPFGEPNDKKPCSSKKPARLFTTAVIFCLLIALGAISWFALYVANVNVGD